MGSGRWAKGPSYPGSVPMEPPGVSSGSLAHHLSGGFLHPSSTSPKSGLFLVSKFEEALNKNSSEYFCLVSVSVAFFFETVCFYLFCIMKYKIYTENVTHTHTHTHTQLLNKSSLTPLQPPVQEVKHHLKFPNFSLFWKGNHYFDFVPCNLLLPIF